MCSNDSRRVAAPVAKTQTSKVEAPVSAAPETVSQPSAGGSYVASQTADDGFDDFDPRGSGFSASGEFLIVYYDVHMFPIWMGRGRKQK